MVRFWSRPAARSTEIDSARQLFVPTLELTGQHYRNPVTIKHENRHINIRWISLVSSPAGLRHGEICGGWTAAPRDQRQFFGAEGFEVAFSSALGGFFAAGFFLVVAFLSGALSSTITTFLGGAAAAAAAALCAACSSVRN